MASEKANAKSIRSFRDRSLITGRGKLQNGRRGQVKVYPYKKMGREGGRHWLSHAEGGRF